MLFIVQNALSQFLRDSLVLYATHKQKTGNKIYKTDKMRNTVGRTDAESEAGRKKARVL